MSDETKEPKPQLVEVMLENIKPQKIEVNKGKIDRTEILLVPKGMEAVSLKEFIDEEKVVPDRREGTHTALDVNTFIEITNRFKNDDSVVFAQAQVANNTISASLLSVLDFHPAGGENDKAANLDHKVSYKFPISKELAFWLRLNGTELGQTDFALLLEERIGEMTVAQESDISAIKNLKPKFADPLEILSLSRDLEIYSNVKVKQAAKLSSGERKLEFDEAHVDATGKAISIPDFFMLSIPIFVGGKSEKVTVRLRYRKKGEGVVWFYDLYRVDQVFQTAFETITKDVAEKTKLPLYLGSPAE